MTTKEQSSARKRAPVDQELRTLKTITNALDVLDDMTRGRVVAYLVARYVRG